MRFAVVVVVAAAAAACVVERPRDTCVEDVVVDANVTTGIEDCSQTGKHRRPGVTCAPPLSCSRSTETSECRVDADCGVGACVDSAFDDECECVRVCAVDDDCDSDEACACATDDFLNLHSRCVPAACRSDDDCGDGGSCGVGIETACGGVEGFFCRAGDDACVTDDDCGEFERCGVNGTDSWSCQLPSSCN